MFKFSSLTLREGCRLNGEKGLDNERGQWESKKWEQSGELELKLLIGLGFKLGFFPNFHFSVPRSPFSAPCSPLPVPRSSFLVLVTSLPECL